MALVQGDISVQIALATDSNIAADNIVNTWAIHQRGSADPAAADAAFQAFYVDIEEYLSPVLSSATVHTTKMYDLTQPEPRVPFYESQWGGVGGEGTAMPTEVACCSSFASPVGSGENRARRRGRVFLGPLNTSCQEIVQSYPRPSAAFRQDVADAMVGLTSALDLADYDLAVWSRADSTLFWVSHGWINDEFDTQRRRGPEVTTRTTWSVSI